MTRIRFLTISDQFYKTVFLGFSLCLVVLGLVEILGLVYNRFFSFVFVLVAVATVVPVVVLALTPLIAGHDPLPKPLHLTAVTIASAICNVQNGRATLIQCFYNMLLPFPQGCQISWKMVQQGSHCFQNILSSSIFIFHISHNFPCCHGAAEFLDVRMLSSKQV